MIITAVVLAVIVGVLHALGYPLPRPWLTVAVVGIVVLLVAGILSLLGLLPHFGYLARY